MSLELLAQCFREEGSQFVPVLYGLLDEQGGSSLLVHTIIKLLNNDVARASDTTTVLRGTSLGTRLMEILLKTSGIYYLETALKGILESINEKNEIIELDPNVNSSAAVLASSGEKLNTYLQAIWEALQNASEYCPTNIKEVLRGVTRGVGNEKIKHRIASSIFFLHFVCSALVSPSVFGILPEDPKPNARRTLILISKVLQWSANFTRDPPKQEYLHTFVQQRLQPVPDIHAFLETMLQSEGRRSIDSKYGAQFNLYLAKMHILLYREQEKLMSLGNQTDSKFLKDLNRATEAIWTKLSVFDPVSPPVYHEYNKAAKARAQRALNPRFSVRLPPPLSEEETLFYSADQETFVSMADLGETVSD